MAKFISFIILILGLLFSNSSLAHNLSLNPATWDFGDVYLGEYSTQVFTLTNNGNTKIRSLDISVSSPFDVVNDHCGRQLKAFESCQFSVRFEPSSVKTYTKNIRIEFEGGQILAQVTGNGKWGADLSLTPSSYNYGQVFIQNFKDFSFTLKNNGNRTAKNLSYQIGAPFSLLSKTCGNNLGPSSSCQVTLRFLPTALGTFSASFKALSNCDTTSATLNGEGIAGNYLTLNPSQQDFGGVLVGQNATQVFTLTNTGPIPINGFNFSLLSPFSVLTSQCTGSLSQNQSCQFTVAFSPSSPGSFSQTVVISAGAQSASAALSGIGLAGPALSLTPSTYDFGTVEVGSMGLAIFQFSNTGDMAAIGLSYSVTSPFQIVSNTCLATLNPQENCTIQVSFTPAASSVVNGILMAGALQANLTGQGHVATALNPGDLDPSFGTEGLKVYRLAGGNLVVTSMDEMVDGKILLAGYFQTSSNTQMVVLRTLSNGDLDLSYGNGGMVIFNFSGTEDRLNAIKALPGGISLVAGYTHNGTNRDVLLARLDSYGNIDATFGTDNGFTIIDMGYQDEMANALALDSQGRILITGQSYIEIENDFFLARLSPQGILDNTFSDDGVTTYNFGFGDDRAFTLVNDSLDNIYLGGYARAENGRRIMALAKFDSLGALDFSFNGSGTKTFEVVTGNSQVRGLVLEDNRIVFSGFGLSGTQNKTFIIGLTYDGNLDAAFGNAGMTEIALSGTGANGRAMTKDQDGNYLIVGSDFSIGTQRIFVARFNSSGMSDSTFGNDGRVSLSVSSSTQDNGYVVTTQDSEGKILLAGTTYDGTSIGIVVGRVQN